MSKVTVTDVTDEELKGAEHATSLFNEGVVSSTPEGEQPHLLSVVEYVNQRIQEAADSTFQSWISQARAARAESLGLQQLGEAISSASDEKLEQIFPLIEQAKEILNG